MTTTLKSAVVALALAVCGFASGTTQANPPHPVFHPSYHHNYHVNYGHRFSHGYYFSGSYYNHFTYRQWNSRYGCYFYYYPGTSSYYYWSGANNCYYPTSYATVVVPNGPAPAGIMTLPLH